MEERIPIKGAGVSAVALSKAVRELSDGQVTHLVRQIHASLKVPATPGTLMTPRQSAQLGRKLLLELCTGTPTLADWIWSENKRRTSVSLGIERLAFEEIADVGRYCVSNAAKPSVAETILWSILRQARPNRPASSAARPPPTASAAEPPEMESAGSDAPSSESTPTASTERWINAKIEGHRPGEPLPALVPFELKLGVELNKSDDAVAADKFSAAFPEDVETIELSIVLDSDDCDIEVKDDRICVPRTGPSTRDARFLVTPRQDGPCTLRAFVMVGGNFVQRLKIPLVIGAVGSQPTPPEATGRTINSIVGLGRRDLTLVIQPAPGDGFECTVIGTTHATCRLPVKQAQLASAIRAARKAIMDVILSKDDKKAYPFQTSVDIGPAQRDAALRTLAEAGYLLFQEIFFGPGTDAQAHAVGKWLIRLANDDQQILKVQVVAKDFPLPWAMLYLGESMDPAAPVDWRRFLGMRHVIEQIPSQMNLSTPDERIGRTDSPLRISLTFNKAIDDQMSSNHVSRQEDYWAAVAGRLARPLACTTRMGRKDFLAALNDDQCVDEIFYLFCHAETVDLQNANGPAASWLALAGDDRVTLRDLRLAAPEMNPLHGNPLVFINACESAELSPEFYDGFVPYFMGKGARGVIGTECKTPALFAVDWSMEFFDRFLKGKPLGEVVLELRQKFYEIHGNPLGLIYAVHCDADTVVAQPSS